MSVDRFPLTYGNAVPKWEGGPVSFQVFYVPGIVEDNIVFNGFLQLVAESGIVVAFDRDDGSTSYGVVIPPTWEPSCVS